MSTANTFDATSFSAIVTGAAGALGRATALRLAEDGFAVGVLGRTSKDLELTAQLINDAGGRAALLECDLDDPSTIDAAVESCENQLGPLWGFVNNAAMYPTIPFLETSRTQFEEVVRVNQTAYFMGAQAAAKRMVTRDGGSIVQIGSITWHGGWELLSSYVTTKGAAVAMSRALARELGPKGVRVNTISPGAFHTRAEEIHPDPEEYNRFVLERQALKRRGKGEELAAVVSFLLGADSSFITGQNIEVDGGWVMV